MAKRKNPYKIMYGAAKRFKSYVGPAVATAAQMYYGKTMSTQTRNSNDQVQTTNQFDTKVQYKKRRVSRRKYKRAKRSFRAYVRNSLRCLGTNTVVKNDSATVSTTQLVPQTWTIVHLGATNGTSTAEPGLGDINSLVSSDTRIGSSGKLLIKTSNLDVTFRNVSTANAAEVDIYHLTYWDETKETSFNGIQTAAVNNTPAIGSLTGLTLLQRGVQLFDIPEIFKKGVKCLKKTKVQLPAGNTATYRLKNNYRWISPANDIQDSTGYVKPKYTQSLLFVVKSTVGTADQAVTLTVGATRKYMYKIYEDDQDRDGLLP